MHNAVGTVYSPISQFDESAGATSPLKGHLGAFISDDGMIDEDRPVYHADSFVMTSDTDGDLSTVRMSSTDSQVPLKSKKSMFDFMFFTSRNSEYVIQGT